MWKEASKLTTSSIRLSILVEPRLVTAGQTDTDRHGAIAYTALE